MGAYLDSPIKDKNPENGRNDYLKWGACSMQGWRCGMEDSHVCMDIKLPNGETGTFFGVFDGHGGKEVAIYAKDHIKRVLDSEMKGKDIKKALENTFMKLDAEISD